MTIDQLLFILVFLIAAVFVVPLFSKLGLSSVVGYLVAGALIGPFGFALIHDYERLLHLAELGVVFLLFIIGLEMKPKTLWTQKKSLMSYGLSQVVLTTSIYSLIIYWTGQSAKVSIIAGFALALSSTAIALQILSEKKQMTSQHGRTSFIVLLFQDIAAIPMLAIVPFLGLIDLSHGQTPTELVLKAVATIVSVLVLGKFVLPYVLRMAARTRTRELFTAASLLILFSVAALMASAQLSMALGSFIAGVLLSESEYKHQLEADIEPFKGLLLGLFFMAIGMSLNFQVLKTQWLEITSALLFFTFLKILILFAIAKSHKLTSYSALSMGVVLSQGSEFAFVIFQAGLNNQLFTKDLVEFLMVLITLSMPLSALLMLGFDRWTKRVKPQLQNYDEINEDNPIIIAGFGRVGQIPGRILNVLDIRFTALEANQDQVDLLRKFGNKVFYGDASRVELLKAAGADKAKVLIVAIDDVEASLKTVQVAMENFPNLKIIARARNRIHHFSLLDLGVKEIFRETLPSSLEIAGATLRELGYETEKIKRVIQTFRYHDEALVVEQQKIRNNVPGMISQTKAAMDQLTQVLRSDEVNEGLAETITSQLGEETQAPAGPA